MKNYSPINDNKDIITKEYADSNYTTLATEQSISGIKRFTNENGIYINRINNINGNAAYDFDGTNVRFGGLTRPLHFRGSLERPKYTTGDGTTFQDIAFVSDIPTSINGLSGGTLTSPLTLTGGDSATASKIILSSNGQITDSGTATMLGFSGGNYIVGSGNYPTTFRGKQTRPPWNGKDLALYSDIPAAITESTVSGWGFTKNKGTVTSVAVKMNGSEKGKVTSSGTIDLGTVLTTHQTIKTLNTNNATAQTVSGSEAISGSGTINLHKIAKTGNYNDLSNTPTILSEADVKGIKVNNAVYADSAGYVKNSIVYQGVGLNADANYSNFVTYNGSTARSIKFYKYDFQMQDALGSGDAELTLRNTGVTAGTYNSVTVDTKGRVTAGTNTPAVDTSNFAKLDTENTFTKGQVITGQTSDGYSVKASGYVKGSWLQSQTKSNKGSNTGMVCVFDSNGWIYYRTPSEILSEASGVPKSAFSLSGTTLTITI